ncbi:MAG: methylglyoxal synthase [Gaiellales bacterium]|nr:methylglyoxal synthase [Gaiellales bacterium]
MDGMIALIAHDGTKDEMLALAEEFRAQLEEVAVVATATTGGVLRCELELDVRCVLSGPLGGDLQIGSMVAGGFVKLVIFLRDPLTAHAHDPDIQALLKVCDVQRVALATNVATARLCLAALAPVL